MGYDGLCRHGCQAHAQTGPPTTPKGSGFPVHDYPLSKIRGHFHDLTYKVWCAYLTVPQWVVGVK